MPDPSDPDVDELAEQVGGVRELARRLVRDGSVAEDVAQETWLAAVGRSRPEDVPLRWWLAGIARNLARRFARGEGRRTRRERAVARDETTEPAVELVARAEIHRRVVGAVLELDEPYRTTLLLRFFDDLTSAEIARRLGVPAATVRSRLKRGLELLRERFDRESRGDRRVWALSILPLAGWPRGPVSPVTMTGALAMKTTTKVGLAAALLLLAAGGVALFGVERPTGPRSTSPLPQTAAARPAPEPPAAPGSIEGVVRRSDTTRVVAGAAVTARDGGAELVARTDASGRFRLDGIVSGQRVSVAADLAGFRPHAARDATVEPGRSLDVGTLWLAPSAGLDVVVLSRADAPVAGARIEVFTGWRRIGPGWSMLDEALTTPRPVASVTTGADGRAALRDLGSGEIRIVACKRGFSSATAWRRAGPASDRETVVVRLGEGHSLAGRVLDGAGRTVAGALVAVEGPSRHDTRSGADGTFLLTELSRGDFALKSARPGATAVLLVPKVRVPDVERIDVVLPDAARIEGTVTDADTGAAIAGATVRARGAWTMAQTTTDAAGRYVLDGLGEGVVQWIDAASGDRVLVLPDDADPARLHFAIRAGATTVRDLTLRRGASLVGVVEGPEGPVPGATVRVVLRHGYDWQSATTDDAGRYSFAALPPGRVSVMVEKDGGWSAADGSYDREPQTLIPATGAVTRDLRLVRNASVVDGCVVDVAGRPLADVRVGYDAATCVSRADGTFHCEGLVAAKDAWFVCTKEGFIESRSTLDLSSERAAGVTIRLARVRRVVGTVRASGAEPVRDAEVDLTAVTTEMRSQFGGGSSPYVVSVPDVPVLPDGTFEAELPWAGGGVLRASAHAADGLTGWTADRALDPTRDEERIDVVMESGVTIEGTVIDEATGAGIGGATVGCGAGGMATTSSDGSFVARHVVPYPGGCGFAAGSCSISASAPGYAIAGFLTVDETMRRGVRIALSRGLEISGLVRFADGSPGAGLGVGADRDYGESFGAPRDRSITGSDGRFVLRGLTPGAHRLHVGAPQRVVVDIVPLVSDPIEAGATDIVLVVRRGGTIAGTVCDDAGRPLSGITVTAAARGARVVAAARTVTGGDGSFRLTGLPDGVLDVAATREPYPNTAPLLPARRQGVAPGTTDLAFVLRPALAIEGVVIDGDGKPATGLCLEAGGRRTVTDDEGRFRIDGLAPGRHAVAVVPPSEARLDASAEVDAGARDLRLVVRDRR